ncbi:hypothetical protein K438DRAFT_1764610 [Mycena galopus ATCC 62051]|nr:hypothetical protein K438DRAFT_1764610 [Mycena galopus ATCC 62051]
MDCSIEVGSEVDLGWGSTMGLQQRFIARMYWVQCESGVRQYHRGRSSGSGEGVDGGRAYSPDKVLSARLPAPATAPSLALDYPGSKSLILCIHVLPPSTTAQGKAKATEYNSDSEQGIRVTAKPLKCKGPPRLSLYRPTQNYTELDRGCVVGYTEVVCVALARDLD